VAELHIGHRRWLLSLYPRAARINKPDVPYENIRMTK